MTKEQAIKLLRKDTSISEIHKLRDNGLSHTEVTDAIQEAMDLGADAIEKQIAKKVIIPSTDLGRYYHQESCPNCKKEFSVRICGYKFKDVIGKTNYCHNCGQKIDWSEVE